jgi:hypothetical protein
MMMADKPFSSRNGRKILIETGLLFTRYVIIWIITIIIEKLGIVLFCFGVALIALPRVGAQQPVSPNPAEIPATPSAGVASLVAHNLSPKPNRTLSIAAPVNSEMPQPDRTKVIRIYSGAGFFDLLLAEKLRPELSKSFAASKSGIAKPTTGQIAAPAQVAGPKQIPVVSNL